MLWHTFQPLFAQAAQEAAGGSHQEAWLKALLILAILIIPSLIGQAMARSIRMPDYGWKIGLILTALAAGITVVAFGWPPRLGIDLKGGVKLIYQLDQSKLRNVNVDKLLKQLADQANQVGGFGKKKAEVIAVGDGRLEVKLPTTDSEKVDKIQAALSAADFNKTLNESLGVTVSLVDSRAGDGTTTLVYQANHNENAVDMDKLISAVKGRVNPGGQLEVDIRKVGTDQIEVSIPDVDPAEIKKIKDKIASVGALEFRIVADSNIPEHQEAIDAAKREINNPATEVSNGEEVVAQWVDLGPGVAVQRSYLTRPKPNSNKTQILVMRDPYDVTGGYLTNASQGISEEGPCVQFSFNTQGAQRFGELTVSNLPDPVSGQTARAGHCARRRTQVGRLDPLAHHTIGSNHQLPLYQRGDRPDRRSVECRQLARRPPKRASQRRPDQRRVGARHDQEQLPLDDRLHRRRVAVHAGVLPLRGDRRQLRGAGQFDARAGADDPDRRRLHPGGASRIGAQRRHGGRFERAHLRTDARGRERGAAMRMVIRNGFGRAMATIIDMHATTIITSIILFVIGSEQLRGFALTLFLGLVVNLFTAVFCARVVFDIWERQKWLTKLKMLKLFGETKIDFVSVMKPAIAISILISVAGLVAVGLRGRTILDVDFTGGTEVQLALNAKDAMDVSKVREVLESKEVADVLPDVTVNAVTTSHNTEFTIRTSNEDIKAVKNELTTAFGQKLRRYRVSVTHPHTIEAKPPTPGTTTTTSTEPKGVPIVPPLPPTEKLTPPATTPPVITPPATTPPATTPPAKTPPATTPPPTVPPVTPPPTAPPAKTAPEKTSGRETDTKSTDKSAAPKTTSATPPEPKSEPKLDTKKRDEKPPLPPPPGGTSSLLRINRDLLALAFPDALLAGETTTTESDAAKEKPSPTSEQPAAPAPKCRPSQARPIQKKPTPKKARPGRKPTTPR